jgi:hypothetical protein
VTLLLPELVIHMLEPSKAIASGDCPTLKVPSIAPSLARRRRQSLEAPKTLKVSCSAPLLALSLRVRVIVPTCRIPEGHHSETEQVRFGWLCRSAVGPPDPNITLRPANPILMRPLLQLPHGNNPQTLPKRYYKFMTSPSCPA